METVSENTPPRRRRGRPRFEPEWIGELERRGNDLSEATNRTRQNVLYRAAAMDVLGIADNPRGHPYPHLWNGPSRRRGARKDRVLTEIGRISYALGREVAVDWAAKIEALYANGGLGTVSEGADQLRAIRLAMLAKSG